MYSLVEWVKSDPLIMSLVVLGVLAVVSALVFRLVNKARRDPVINEGKRR